MTVLGTVVTLGLLLAAVLTWRRRAAAADQRSWRRLLVFSTVALVALAALFTVVTAANVSTALDPSPALAGFLAGGG